MQLGIRRSPKLKCPYPECRAFREHLSGQAGSPGLRLVVRKGSYRRRSDSAAVSRFHCRRCNRSFSSSRFTPCFGQKKRKLNEPIRKLLCSGVSQRRIALLLGINRKTVVRKFLYLAGQAKLEHARFLEEVRYLRLDTVQFDEMESSERSKCLPLSIPLMVDARSRKILGFRVCSMPAKGLLARISYKKYGPRPDDRKQAALDLFDELKPVLASRVRITSDENPKYPSWIEAKFLEVTHRTTKGRRGCVVGQGELKKIGKDPLFSLNHTCAMIRANVNRLFRRTWCTTKRADRLADHLYLYVQFHNQVLTA